MKILKKTEIKLAKIMKIAATPIEKGYPNNEADKDLLLSEFRKGNLFRAKGSTMKNGPAPFHYFTQKAGADEFGKRHGIAAQPVPVLAKEWNAPVIVQMPKTVWVTPPVKPGKVVMPLGVRVVQCPSPTYQPLNMTAVWRDCAAGAHRASCRVLRDEVTV